MTKAQEFEIYVAVSKGLIALLNGAITREQCREYIKRFTNASDTDCDEMIDGAITIACRQVKKTFEEITNERSDRTRTRGRT